MSSDDVLRWYHRRTYRAADHEVGELARRKAERGVTVSVVIPARNEAETIAGVVEMVAGLPSPLVDELVVMDGGSTDGTQERAAAAGARVHADTAVLSEHGRAEGKGDALWRSLAVTSGDVVAFIDADLRDPDPALLWGLLVPLLDDDGVGLVKAFYDRPIEGASGRQPSGGGRVTELCARPLLNLLWPPLSGLVQPLSGEYAGRRELLEAIPFFTGYGVEIGMLVDTLHQEGIDAIAQIDVGERVHRNQPLPDLSRMAAAIAQVALRRLDAEQRLRLAELFPAGGEIPRAYVQFDRDADGLTTPAVHEITVTERPPIAAIRGDAPA